MPDDKKSTSKDHGTSDDILKSLVEDIHKGVGSDQVDDLVIFMNSGKTKKKKSSSKDGKRHRSPADDEGSSSSKPKEKKAKKKKSKHKDDDDDTKDSSIVKSNGKSKDKSKDKSKKKKKSKTSKEDGADKAVAVKKKSKKLKSSTSIATTTKRKSSPSSKRKASRSRSPHKRRSSDSPKRNERRRSLTPPMYKSKWGRYRSNFARDKKQSTHTRDNDGLMPWERDRWSRERSRSWSPTRFRRPRRSRSPKPLEIDERRIDKRELLEIARKNATRLAMEGRLPKGIELGATLKNKSVRELIQLCEEIRSRDLEIAPPESFVAPENEDNDSGDFSTAPVKSSSIRINLKDGSSRGGKSNLERLIEENALKKHFPVSSGETHTDTKGGKDWQPVDSEQPVPEEGIVTALSKKTVKIPTAYKAYKLPDECVKPKKESAEPLVTEQPPPAMLAFGTTFPVPSFPSMSTGYEAPEIISAAFMPPPPPPVFSSFNDPAKSPPPPEVPPPAPLMVISNEDLAQSEELKKLEEEAEKMNAEKNAKPTEVGDPADPSTENTEAQGADKQQQQDVEVPDGQEKQPSPLVIGPILPPSATGDGETPSTSTEHQTVVPMEIEDPSKDEREEGVASPTPPPPDYTLPEGAVLEKPVAPPSIFGLVSRRARIVKELNQDPNNSQLRMEIADIDLKLSLWAKVKSETTAHFGAASNITHVVEPRPIMNSIWATKDTLRNAPQFKGGIGEHLLKKMGWEPGQGLGRKMDGPVEPLVLDVKSDRKGLYSAKDKAPPRREHAATVNGNKNPVSVIMEFCAKRGLPPPLFMEIEDGPPNRRRFGCKAVLNGVEYEAAAGATNKKAAKAQVCLIMCQAMGLAS